MAHREMTGRFLDFGYGPIWESVPIGEMVKYTGMRPMINLTSIQTRSINLEHLLHRNIPLQAYGRNRRWYAYSELMLVSKEILLTIWYGGTDRSAYKES